MSSFKDWLDQWSQHLVNEQLKCSPTQKSPRWTVSAVGSRCSWLTAVSGRAFPSFLLLGSSCPARIAEEPNWSQVRPPGDLLHYNAPRDFGEGEEEMLFQEHSKPLSWSSSYSTGQAWPKPCPAPRGLASSLLSFVSIRFEAHLNLPVHGCHLEIM